MRETNHQRGVENVAARGSQSARCGRRGSGRHLYLVLDDCERGYSIYRLGEDDLDSGATRAAASPLVRVEAQHAFEPSFAAHGTKILAMHPSALSPGVPVFDTETLGVTVCSFPRSRTALGARKLVHTSVGGSLLAFVSCCLELLGAEPLPADEPPSPLSWSWASIEPPQPFESSGVSGYALHPDGRAVVMSVKNWGDEAHKGRGKRNSTFAFDAERLEWTHLGEWLLPFKGRAHYDRELDAWIGICLHEEGAGHLCGCDVPPPAAEGCQTTTTPAWKLGKDVFFDEDSGRHAGATLVYMGDSRFCVIECQVPDGDCGEMIWCSQRVPCFGAPDRYSA